MNLHRLERHQHPKPPHQELRQKSVFDSGSRNVGQVGNLYVDEDSKSPSIRSALRCRCPRGEIEDGDMYVMRLRTRGGIADEW